MGRVAGRRQNVLLDRIRETAEERGMYALRIEAAVWEVPATPALRPAAYPYSRVPGFPHTGRSDGSQADSHGDSVVRTTVCATRLDQRTNCPKRDSHMDRTYT